MREQAALKAKLHLVSKARGLTFSELARRLDLPFSTLHSWIRGQAKTPERQREAIARELDVDPDYLWKGNDLEIPAYKKAGKATSGQAQ